MSQNERRDYFARVQHEWSDKQTSALTITSPGGRQEARRRTNGGTRTGCVAAIKRQGFLPYGPAPSRKTAD